MTSEKRTISRKDAIKRLGGLALSLPVGLPLISSIAGTSVASASHSPNIIPHRKSDKPNVLWITAEGVPISVLRNYISNRWGDLRSNLVATPHINRIAEEGMQFQNSFCTNALCAPSRASILTGKYSQLNGVTANITANPSGHPSRNDFNVNQPTFAKIMQQNGYQTATIGKWHLQDEDYKPINPTQVGFDKFAFKTGAGGPYYNPHGYLQNLDTGGSKMEQKSHPGYITDVFTDMALQTMKSFDQPFLMFMNFFDDHRPFQPPHKYAHLYDGRRIPEPTTFWDDYEHRSSAAEAARMRIAYMPDWNAPKDLTLRQRQQYNYQKLMEHFLGTLKALDDNVGKLLNYLDKSGLA
ncbi:MAG TPA: sulfatase-like hydrolase/transferase, partial [Chitinophagaceae bacterium]|nr:sulfatase-like hydrolase/transferase [Chitinophagaceae bacterium]